MTSKTLVEFYLFIYFLTYYQFHCINGRRCRVAVVLRGVSLLLRMRPLWFYPLRCHMTSYYRLSRRYAFACHYSSLLMVYIFSFPLAPFARRKPFSYTSRLLLFHYFTLRHKRRGVPQHSLTIFLLRCLDLSESI